VDALVEDAFARTEVVDLCSEPKQA
jgi:hypothetical protein